MKKRYLLLSFIAVLLIINFAGCSKMTDPSSMDPGSSDLFRTTGVADNQDPCTGPLTDDPMAYSNKGYYHEAEKYDSYVCNSGEIWITKFQKNSVSAEAALLFGNHGNCGGHQESVEYSVKFDESLSDSYFFIRYAYREENGVIEVFLDNIRQGEFAVGRHGNSRETRFLWTKQAINFGKISAGVHSIKLCLKNGGEHGVWLDVFRIEYVCPSIKPIAYWSYDDNSTSTVKDDSGNGFDGIIFGDIVFQAGKKNLAGYVNRSGNGGYVQVGDNPKFHMTDAVTIAAWVNPDRTSGLQTILNRWYAMDSYMLLIENNEYKFSVALPTGGWGTVKYVTYPARAGEWAHVAGVFNGKTICLYVNGNLVASAEAIGTLQQSTRPIVMGSHPSWNQYKGLIDEVYLFDKPLNGKEVSDLMNR